MEHLISAEVLARKDAIRDAFQGAKPFKHACIEDFFPQAYAEELLREFPPFDPQAAINEFGKVGGKAVKTGLRSIGPAYDKLFSYLSSPPFLDAMSEMLGIPGLLFDPQMYGGGTHENLPGQELDPHVDFNYDQARNVHRRVNLLVYLNPEWEESWGGAIQLHSNPRDWEHDQVKTFNCTFNRCVVFETNEYSWHGFRRIQPPAEKRALSRKCISIYLYTKDRPQEEIAPAHGTFYVQRPMPPEVVEGHTLRRDEVDEIKQLLTNRDNYIKFYQDLELKFSGERDVSVSYIQDLELTLSRERAESARYIRELMGSMQLPLTGYLLQKTGSAEGIYADGWAASHLKVTATPLTKVKSLKIRGWIPESRAPGMRLRATIDGVPAGEVEPRPGRKFKWKLKLPSKLAKEFTLAIDAVGLEKAPGSDDRDLAYVLIEIRAQH